MPKTLVWREMIVAIKIVSVFGMTLKFQKSSIKMQSLQTTNPFHANKTQNTCGHGHTRGQSTNTIEVDSIIHFQRI